MLSKKFISEAQVLSDLDFSRSTLIRMEKAGQFPRRIKLTPRRVAFDAAAVEAWKEDMARRSSEG